MKPTFETERLILRPWRESDADDLFEYAGGDSVGPMAGWKPHKDVRESQNLIKTFIDEDETWAITDKESGKMIGSIGLHKRRREGIDFDYELGYVLSEKYWGKGIMTEAAKRIIEYSFAELGAERLICCHFDFNDRSKGVIFKLGFRYLTRLEKNWTRYDGEILDEEVYYMDKSFYDVFHGAKNFGFGLMRLPVLDENDQKTVDMPQFKQMTDEFLAAGFTYFDTAYMYHDFKSENFVKEALVERYPRDSFTLTSKLPVSMLTCVDDVTRIFNEQLQKCGVDFFDYYLLHSVGGANIQIVQDYDLHAFMQKLKADGKAKHVGISYHDNADLLNKILDENDYIEFVQLQINYLDWENSNVQAKACYDVCVQHKKPVIVMEPVRGGSLTQLPQSAQKLFKSYAKNVSFASWAIRYSASLPNVAMVLSGMSSIEQMRDNLGFMKHFMPINTAEREIIEKVKDILVDEISIPCTGCGYCTRVCKQHIAIPRFFANYNADVQSLNHLFSVQQTYYLNFTENRTKASDCVNCRLCCKECPQHIDIPKQLKLVAERFE